MIFWGSHFLLFLVILLIFWLADTLPHISRWHKITWPKSWTKMLDLILHLALLHQHRWGRLLTGQNAKWGFFGLDNPCNLGQIRFKLEAFKQKLHCDQRSALKMYEKDTSRYVQIAHWTLMECKKRTSMWTNGFVEQKNSNGFLGHKKSLLTSLTLPPPPYPYIP